MTIQKRAVFMLVYFIVTQILIFLSRKLLWVSVCKSGGTTPQGVREKTPELMRERVPQETYRLISEFG